MIINNYAILHSLDTMPLIFIITNLDLKIQANGRIIANNQKRFGLNRIEQLLNGLNGSIRFGSCLGFLNSSVWFRFSFNKLETMVLTI
mgnify:CR=1 FL=1